jgi:hypothetical protein
MADRDEAKSEPKKDVYDLAYTVSERVQINNVLLAHCEATRSGHPISSRLKTSTVVSEIGPARIPESKQVLVMVSFALKSTQGDEIDSEEPLSIKASFMLSYSVSSLDGIDDEHLKAFAATNGVFNAWPYWRELVQSTTCRMGLVKPVIVPVFRLGQKTLVKQMPEHTPSD